MINQNIKSDYMLPVFNLCKIRLNVFRTVSARMLLIFFHYGKLFIACFPPNLQFKTGFKTLQNHLKLRNEAEQQEEKFHKTKDHWTGEYILPSTLLESARQDKLMIN